LEFDAYAKCLSIFENEVLGKAIRKNTEDEYENDDEDYLVRTTKTDQLYGNV